MGTTNHESTMNGRAKSIHFLTQIFFLYFYQIDDFVEPRSLVAACVSSSFVLTWLHFQLSHPGKHQEWSLQRMKLIRPQRLRRCYDQYCVLVASRCVCASWSRRVTGISSKAVAWTVQRSGPIVDEHQSIYCYGLSSHTNESDSEVLLRYAFWFSPSSLASLATGASSQLLDCPQSTVEPPCVRRTSRTLVSRPGLLYREVENLCLRLDLDETEHNEDLTAGVIKAHSALRQYSYP